MQTVWGEKCDICNQHSQLYQTIVMSNSKMTKKVFRYLRGRGGVNKMSCNEVQDPLAKIDQGSMVILTLLKLGLDSFDA